MMALIYALLFLVAIGPAIALHNITVDDTDKAITYRGAWNNGLNEPDSFGGGHRSSTDASASATFVFTGTAIYYLSPLFSGYTPGVSTLLKLDSQPAVWVNLTQPSSVAAKSAIRWSQTGLQNVQHTLVISKGTSPSGQRATWGEVDGFIYAVPDAPSPDHPAPSPAHPAPSKIGAIVGGAVSGGVAAALLALLAFLNAKHLSYLLGSLAFLLFGLFLFRARRLVFRVDDNVGPTKISFFLTGTDSPTDYQKGDETRVLVWKVFEVGGERRDFTITVPCTSRWGLPKFSYATITDNSRVVQCLSSSLAPAVLNKSSTWNAPPETGNGFANPERYARNEADKPVRIALGLFDEEDESTESFLLIEELRQGSQYQPPAELFLHAFRSYGCDHTPGQYKDNLFEEIRHDRLTPARGLKVSELKPLTSWNIRSDDGGKTLRLEVGENRPQDVKAYKHDCTVHKGAKKSGNGV